MSGKEFISPFYDFLIGVYNYLKLDDSTISEKGNIILNSEDEEKLMNAINNYHARITTPTKNVSKKGETTKRSSADFKTSKGVEYVISSH